MTMIERFEDIEAWQKARELSKAIYMVTCDGAFARDFGLRDQIRRAGVSVMSNIAEGFDRGGNRELIQFLYFAKGSAAELQTQLYIALDIGYISQDQFQQLYDLAGTTGRLIGGFIRYLKTCNAKPATRNPQPKSK
ncbi:MAG: four helix bundle protein [candidate division Zixibacteria bacterium RBG_16_53_22]|nr:MAG: four helix bundle protein [candidate division Zixibacteria bacterium RBG_16_53_22]